MKKEYAYQPVKTHNFVFNPLDNGGEQLVLTTEFHANGDYVTDDTGIYATHKLRLNSYSNAVTLSLDGHLTPQNLRKLADELEAIRKQISNNRSA